MRIEQIPVGDNPPDDINVVIEVPLGGEPVKYEMDKASGTMFVDRILYTSMRYPGNYGFVPQTLSGDGDPIDVLVANQRPLMSGSVINCRPVGVLYMKDEAGEDEKIVAVPSIKVSAMFNKIITVHDLPQMLLQKISHFFEHYKDLEADKWVEIVRWGDADEAHQMIADAVTRARED